MAFWGFYSPLMFFFYERGIALARYASAGIYSSRGGPKLVEQSYPTPSTAFAVGSTAGILAALATSPLDVVKTRIQCQTPTSIVQYDGMLHGLREVVINEGPRSLFRGVVPRCINAGVTTGLLMATYSAVRTSMLCRAGHGPSAAPVEEMSSSDSRRRSLRWRATNSSDPWLC